MSQLAPKKKSKHLVIFASVEEGNLVVKQVIPANRTFLDIDTSQLEKGSLKFIDLLVPEHREKVKKELEKFLSGKEEHYHFGELRLKTEDGRNLWVLCTLSALDVESKKEVVISIVDITEEKEKEERFYTISEVAPIGILMYSQGRIVFVNKKASDIFEYSAESMLKMNLDAVLKLIFPEDREKALQFIRMREKGIKGKGDYRIRIVTASGKVKWVHINSETVFYRGRPAGIATLEDITKQVKIEKAYRLLSAVNREIVKNRGLNSLFHRIAQVFVSIGEFKTVWIGRLQNESVIVPVAYEGDMQFLGSIEKLLNPVKIKKKETVYDEIIENRPPELIFSVTIPVFWKNRVEYVINLFSDKPHLLSQEEADIFYEISDDISFAVDFIKKEQDLYRKEFYDSLTGLGNRKLFFSRLDEYIEKQEPFYLILIDIYNFKRINEVYGEVVADHVLREVAENLEKVVNPDNLFRIGSDEFALVWKNENIYRALELIKSSFEIPISIKDYMIQPDFNVAVVHYPMDGRYRMELVLKAERTLQLAKEEGKNTIRFFNETEYINTKKFFSYEEKIEEALKNNLFYINLQPIVSVADNSVVGAEALIRLKDKEGNPIPPAELIPVAEKTGQIVMIDNLMIKKASQVLKDWQNKGLNPVKISINVTPSNIKMITDSFLNPEITNFMNINFSEDDIKLLKKYVIFELTEREFVEIAERKEEMKKLREAGFHIAIDDFGTGYSSLSYLTAMELDFIKIDIYFVKNMKKNDRIHKLVQSIINIAKIFGIKTIAEGVETQEELEELKRLGCDLYQGYLFCPPVSPEEFERFLRQKTE
ncbi:sensor domain-containing protein [Persephonella sp.]